MYGLRYPFLHHFRQLFSRHCTRGGSSKVHWVPYMLVISKFHLHIISFVGKEEKELMEDIVGSLEHFTPHTLVYWLMILATSPTFLQWVVQAVTRQFFRKGPKMFLYPPLSTCKEFGKVCLTGWVLQLSVQSHTVTHPKLSLIPVLQRLR